MYFQGPEKYCSQSVKKSSQTDPALSSFHLTDKINMKKGSMTYEQTSYHTINFNLVRKECRRIYAVSCKNQGLLKKK